MTYFFRFLVSQRCHAARAEPDERQRMRGPVPGSVSYFFGFLVSQRCHAARAEPDEHQRMRGPVPGSMTYFFRFLWKKSIVRVQASVAAALS